MSNFNFFRSTTASKLLANLALGVCLVLTSTTTNAQRPRFADPFQSTPAQPVQFQVPPANPPAVGTQNFTQPSIINSPPPIITTTPPSAILQAPVTQTPPAIIQNTDPFVSNSQALPVFGGQIITPSTSQPVFGTQTPQLNLPQSIEVLPPTFQVPQAQPQNQLLTDPFNQQPVIQQPSVVQQPQQVQQFGNPGFGVAPNSIANQWPYGTSGQNWWPSVEWPSQVWARLRENVLPRILERPRFRHTYIFGNNGNELGVNETEVATTATIPNVGRSGQALRISPGFIWHFWDGPDTAVTGVDLPSTTYSGFIGTDFISNPNSPSGMEANVAVGIYSDFDNVSSQSIRVTGTLLGWQRLNSYTTAKLGVEYLDRVDVKILPAFGVFMTPNADLKLDIYFPRPKLAGRVPNIGNFEVWTYVGAEFGGGSWTIERLGMMDDQVDLNEVRSFLGAEWVGPRNVTGFLEFGYVFDRELVYRSDELNKTVLQDSVMIRSGLAF